MAETTLSVDLALAAGAALIGGALARLLNLSVIVGYIAAGIAISPFTPGPQGDVATIELLADIGVVLLMFGIGVHFSLRQLLAARTVAVGAAIQIPLSIALGCGAVLLAGWSWREGIVFGAVISVSGGTVLTKLLSERGEEDSPHGRLAVTWSVVQDVATIALVVLLGVVAHGGDRLLPTLGLATLKAAGFIGGMVLIGTRVFPALLRRIARLGSRELFILAVAGLSLGTAILAESFGLSLALGAFIAGVVVSESDMSYHALGEVLPLRDIFAALFFVSVGMLVDPRLLLERLPLFLLLVLLVLSKGALIIALAIGLLRITARTAVLAGLGLAQSAEFSFVLAREGVEAGVVSASVFSLTLAATVATIVLAPLLYRLAPVLEAMLARLPQRLAREDSVEPPRLRNHVVICGAGRVGQLIIGLLRQRRQGYLVVEMDRRLVERLRASGEPVIYGNAASPPVLDRAQLEYARTLVVAIPDPIVTRGIVAEARQRNPRLDIVVRAASTGEAEALRTQGVSEAVVAERELALEMARHTLHRIGLSIPETQSIIQRLRT